MLQPGVVPVGEFNIVPLAEAPDGFGGGWRNCWGGGWRNCFNCA
ncbi:MAG: hypothetical protein JWN15_2881, partial [Firmicutes bacterium]|nr:hypothetical protein [Bacillota bacterium]